MAITRGRLCGRVYAACVYVSGHWPSAARERERNDHKFNGFSQSSCENKHKERKRKKKRVIFASGALYYYNYSLGPFLFFISRQLHSHPGLEKYHRADRPKRNTHTTNER